MYGSGGVPGYSPRELADRMAHNDDLIILDVREAYELPLASLDGPVVHVAMSRMAAEHLASLPAPLDAPTDREIVVMCHHGVRSAQVTTWLRQQGYGCVFNLDGGIDAYAREIDPGIGLY